MKEIDRLFTYYAPSPEDVQKYEMIRSAAKHLAEVIEQYVPLGRENSIAIDNLRCAVMFANAGIACRTRFEEDRPQGRACDESAKAQISTAEVGDRRRPIGH